MNKMTSVKQYTVSENLFATTENRRSKDINNQLKFLRGKHKAFERSSQRDAAAAAAKLLQSCPTLWDPREGSSPGSPVPGILQTRVLEWAAIAFSEFTFKYSNLFHLLWLQKLLQNIVKVKVNQLCPTLCHPMDYTVHEFFRPKH